MTVEEVVGDVGMTVEGGNGGLGTLEWWLGGFAMVGALAWLIWYSRRAMRGGRVPCAVCGNYWAGKKDDAVQQY